MKLANYSFDNGAGIGAVVGRDILDLRSVAGTDMRAFLEGGSTSLAEAQAALDHADRAQMAPNRLLAPIVHPHAFVAIGLNYGEHAAQLGRALPSVPTMFMKPASAVARPFGTIPRDPNAPSLDYEGELGIVIGRCCRKVSPAEARRYIAGFTVVNDVTVRARVSPDTVTWAKGGFGHAPIGPWVVTADEIGDPHALSIRSWVNGELRQDGNTADMHFDCYALVSWLSEGMTLMPGDIASTGSPAFIGSLVEGPRYLEPGDKVRIEIAGIGAIEQVVENEC